MGADIHCYMEYRDPAAKSWSNFGGRFNPGRDYWMFAILADVRGEGAIIEPRGVPDGLGWSTEDHLYLRVNDKYSGEEGYCSEKNAESWVKNHYSEPVFDDTGKLVKVTNPDWHSYSWFSPSEWKDALDTYHERHCAEGYDAGAEYHALLGAARALEAIGKEVRIVFWFDN